MHALTRHTTSRSVQALVRSVQRPTTTKNITYCFKYKQERTSHRKEQLLVNEMREALA